MKHYKLFPALLFLFVLSVKAETGPSWSTKYEHPKCFIENKGQFHLPNGNEPVEFAYDNSSTRIYFTKKGVTYSFLKVWKDQEEEGEREKDIKKANFQDVRTIEEFRKKEEEEHKAKFIADYVNVEWENSNPNVEIVAEKKISSYFSYTFKDESGKKVNENFLAGYEKITYKNLYPNIDVEYIFHASEGIKYSITLHPGADPSVIKMKYDGNKNLSINNGNLVVSTKLGDIIDHAPITFYGGNVPAVIRSQFIKTGNQISFQLDAYDNTKTVIIDPWTVTPAFATNWDCVWECEKDGAGNVYIIGGVTPLQLIKYNSLGVLQWTYNTPYDTSSWLGTFATDNLGNSYVTQGSVAAIQKVSTVGGLIWDNPSPGGLFASTEFWNIAFNCDQTQLVIGGTGGFLPPLPYVYNVDVSTGNMTASLQVTGGALFPTQEVRSITACGNGKFYWLSHDSIGFFNQNFSFCPSGSSSARYHKTNGYSFGYKCENWRYNNTGINAIRANTNFVYTHRGSIVDKRSLTTANVITSVAIAGGTFSGGQVRNSGIDIDACGNVYVGSQSSVIKYDANLVVLATYPTSFNVYDVHVSTAGEIIACGTTGTSGTAIRTGYIQQISAGACATLALTCCDATICAPATMCVSASAVTLQAATPGGTWSGTGVNAAGVFNPAISGVGSFVITYTLACGTDAVTIVVSPCTALNLCQGPGALSATVSGGTAVYQWQTSTVTNPCISGIGFCSGTPFSVAGPPVTTWTTFATGSTVTLPGTYPIQIVDGSGTIITIPNAAAYAALAACSGCPTLTANITGQVNVACFGASTGSFNASTTGGATPWDYTLMLGATTIATFTNVSGTQAFAGLAAGTYTLNILDNNGCPGTATITITQPGSALSVTLVSSIPTGCSTAPGAATVNASGGTVGSGYSYLWSPLGGSTNVGSFPVSGTYTVTATDANGCTSTLSVFIGMSGGPTSSIVSQTNVNCNGAATGAATAAGSGGIPGYTYSWSGGGGTAATATGLIAGSYTVTVTDSVGCTSASTVVITQNSAITGGVSTTSTACGVTTGTASSSPSGGSGSSYTYLWSPGGATTSGITGLAAGTYTVTITDGLGCTQTATGVVGTTGGPTTSVAGPNQTVCASTATLAGNTPSTGTGLWSLVSGAGTITTPGSPTSGVTGLGVGPNVFMWTIDLPPCAPSTSTVTITGVAPPTTAAAGPNQSICSNSTILAGNTPTVGTGTWTLVSGAGTITTPSSATSGVTGLGVGANVFMWTISNPPCPNSTSTVTITNTGGPSISTTSQTNVDCNGTSTGSATVAGSGGSGSYTYSWTGGAGTSASATGLSAGNYTVTVTDGSGCSNTSIITITQPSAITGLVNTTNATCGLSDGSASVTASGGTGSLNYAWSPGGATTSSITGIPSGLYTVTITDSLGCVSSASGTVGSVGGPAVNAGAGSTITSGGTAILSGSGSPGVSYSWSPSGTVACPTCATTIAAPTQTTTYTLTVTINGCSSYDTVTIFVEIECGELFVPNVFSPNGDGNNDELRVYGNCITNFEFVIFDRWGQKVFEITDPAIFWDGRFNGKMMDAAVFVYYLKGTVKGIDVEKHGNITLVK